MHVEARAAFLPRPNRQAIESRRIRRRFVGTPALATGLLLGSVLLAACGADTSGPVAGMPAGARVFTADAGSNWVSVVDVKSGKDAVT